MCTGILLRWLSSFFLDKRICFEPSLEPRRQEVANDGPQNMFLSRNMDNYPKIILITPSYPFCTRLLLIRCQYNN